ncbi:MAG: hypothetical protein GXO15_06765 [Crenarchaeota archaeon]|nr:hypothetical protein [Thermoproteota archaeon]
MPLLGLEEGFEMLLHREHGVSGPAAADEYPAYAAAGEGFEEPGQPGPRGGEHGAYVPGAAVAAVELAVASGE